MSLYQTVTDAELKDLRAEFDFNADTMAAKYRACGVKGQSVDLLRALALACFLSRQADRTTPTAATYLAILHVCGDTVRRRYIQGGPHHA